MFRKIVISVVSLVIICAFTTGFYFNTKTIDGDIVGYDMPMTAGDEAYVGKLTVPRVKISVALYNSNRQKTIDRKNSAGCFAFQGYRGKIIADHVTQAFRNLHNVQVGDIAYIKNNGNTINLKCVAKFKGHNTGYTLTNLSYDNVLGRYDYTMYTCRGGWRNVWVVGFNVIN